MEAQMNHYHLVEIATRFAVLRNELFCLKGDYETRRANHDTQCSLSLSNSLGSLARVIVYVKKTDKSLIDWHHRSKSLKSALRLIGLDRRTQSILDKKTGILRTMVSDVEETFRGTNERFDESIASAKQFNMDFTCFSQSSVDEVFNKTSSTLIIYDNAHQEVTSNIARQDLKRQELKQEADVTIQAIETTRQAEEKTRAARRGLIGGSILGFGTMVIGLVLCPPTAVIAPLLLGGVGGAGALASGAACAVTSSIRSLEAKQVELNESLTGQDSIIHTLDMRLASLDSDRQTCQKNLATARGFQDQTRATHHEAQLGLDRIRQAQLVLNTMHTSLEHIIDRLNQCSYAESRREIAVKLRQVLNVVMATVQDQVFVIKEENFGQVMRELAGIDLKTNEVVRIANLVSV